METCPMTRILVVDFDGVLNSYKSGWIAPHIIPDPPVPGAIPFLKEAVKHFEVNIFSSRSHDPAGLQAMQDYIDLWAAKDNPAVLLHATPWQRLIKWPLKKPPAFVTLDDRGILFKGTWPTMDELLKFKPWWQLNETPIPDDTPPPEAPSRASVNWVLQNAKKKLELYREAHGSNYVGGMEFTELIQHIDNLLQR